MSEAKVKTPEVKEETTAKKPATTTKKEVAKNVKEKKDNFIKRGGRKVKNWMSEHPFWSSMISAAGGAGLAIGAGFGAKKVMENRRNNRSYIPQEPNQQNDLDPNNL